MALQRTASGRVDKRTKEYKVMCANLAKGRRKVARQNAALKRAASSVKRTKSGKVDKRTAEGKAIAARMAKARRAKGSLSNRLKRLFG